MSKLINPIIIAWKENIVIIILIQQQTIIKLIDKEITNKLWINV